MVVDPSNRDEARTQNESSPSTVGPRRSAFKVYGASKSASPSPVATATDLNNNNLNLNERQSQECLGAKSNQVQSTSGLANKDGQIRKFPAANQAKLSDSRNSVFSTDSDNSALGSLLTRVKSMSDLENTEGVTYEMVRKRSRRRRGASGKNDGASVGSEGSGPSPRNLVSPRQFNTGHGLHHHSPNIPLSMKSSISALSELSECLDEISETPSRKTGSANADQPCSNLNASVLSDMTDHNRSFSPIAFTGSALSPPACRPIPIGRQSPLVSESKVKVVKVVHRPISSRLADQESQVSVNEKKVQTVGFEKKRNLVNYVKIPELPEVEAQGEKKEVKID